VGPPLVDPSTFPSCAPEGGAHCVPEALVPDAQRKELATCAGGYCTPDPFIAANGQYVPPTCTSLGNAEGRCLHVSVPKVADQRSLLPQATCAADEKCVPCYDPRDGSDSGACRLSCDPGPKKPAPGNACPYQGKDELLDPRYFPDCSTDGTATAHCVPQPLVPASQQPLLSPCGSGGLCAPDVYTSRGGRYIAPSCTSIAGAEGRCMNVAIGMVGAQKDALPQDVCAPYERCAPCFDPLTGKDTLSCRQSCDPGPQEPPVRFADCCSETGGSHGKCVPRDALPETMASQLGADVCDSGNLCAPTENLEPGFQPEACSGHSLLLGGTYQGFCVSDCVHMSFLEGLVRKEGTCAPQHKCAPCYKLGKATHVPGCNN
jgi:hypothetical protein